MMAASSSADAQTMEQYKSIFDLWRGERLLGIQLFLGFAVTSSLLALVSLSGTWWPILSGLGLSLLWLVLNAKVAAQQKFLFAELEQLGSASDSPLLRLHEFSAVEIQTPRYPRLSTWAQLVSKHFLLGTPAVLCVAWFVGIIYWAAT